jgi:hypothetical protein
MDNVRPQDIETYESDNEVWVVANSGGISTGSNSRKRKKLVEIKSGNYHSRPNRISE